MNKSFVISRSSYTGLGIHQLMDDGTLGPETVVTGLPEGAKINFVTWYIPRIHLVYFYLSSYEICIVSGQSLKNKKKEKKKKK